MSLFVFKDESSFFPQYLHWLKWCLTTSHHSFNMITVTKLFPYLINVPKIDLFRVLSRSSELLVLGSSSLVETLLELKGM